MRRPALGAAALVVASLVAACGGGGDQELRGIQRTPLPVVGDAALPAVSEDGEAFAFRAPAGELLVVYFGFTACPDVCPTTLADLRVALDDVDDAQAVSVAMATIDPERDTPDVLTGYIQSFVPDAVALRSTDDAELRAAADAFGASYGIEENEDGEPEVFHSGFLYAVDEAGQLLLTWPFGTPSDDMAHDIDLLLDDVAA